MQNKFSLKGAGLFYILVSIIAVLVCGISLLKLSDNYMVFSIFFSFCIVIFALTSLFMLYVYHKLTLFSKDLSSSINIMIEGIQEPAELTYDESLLSKVNHQLFRLYEILCFTRDSAKKERLMLQKLISDISHQVKTPLTTLKLTSSAIVTTLSESIPDQNLLQDMNKQLDKLEFLFDSLITTSRLESGIIELYPNYCNIADTILSALENNTIPAENKDISLTYEYSDCYFAVHDQKWTSEALSNILENAVKYTPEHGKITVEVRKLQNYIMIAVTDTGIGIPDKEIANIFKRFYRGQHTLSLPGIGIGLYLCRDIIERQHGFIYAVSEINSGSTFQVYLPTYG